MPDQDTSVFSSDQSAVAQSPEANTTTQKLDQLPEAVALLVGPGRKYKTLEDLAKGYVSADTHIATLSGENATLREKVAEAKAIEDVLKRLEHQPASGAQDQSAQTTQSGLTAADVARLVRDGITGAESERTKTANLKAADAQLKAIFGEKAKEVFDAQAKSPEMRAALMNLAAVDPKTFVAVFAPAKGAQQQSDSSTVVNTAALNGVTDSGRASDPSCKEFYDTLRKKEPKKYYSSAVQLQMNRAAQADRNKFFGRS